MVWRTGRTRFCCLTMAGVAPGLRRRCTSTTTRYGHGSSAARSDHRGWRPGRDDAVRHDVAGNFPSQIRHRTRCWAKDRHGRQGWLFSRARMVDIECALLVSLHSQCTNLHRDNRHFATGYLTRSVTALELEGARALDNTQGLHGQIGIVAVIGRFQQNRLARHTVAG